MFSDPGILIPLMLAAVLYLLAVLIIIYHRAGLEYVGAAMIILGALWLFQSPFSPAWIVLLSGIAFHGAGRAKRWWKIGTYGDRSSEGKKEQDEHKIRHRPDH